MIDTQTLEEEVAEIESELHIEQKHRDNIQSILEKVREYHEPTYTHSLKVGIKAQQIARFMHLNPKPAFYGIFHDVGKTKIPLEVLAKTEGFNKEDLEVMKAHTTKGYEILTDREYLFSAWMALTHHRYQSPNDYPETLPEWPQALRRGTHLSVDIYSRIVAIADHNDALKRANDRFGDVEMKKLRAKQILLSTNPDQQYLIEQLYSVGVLE